MDDGEWQDTLRGTPRDSSVSPILANIYLHFVLDLWFQRKWRARIARGETIIVRYADDFVVGFQRKRNAERFRCDLKDRLAASHSICTQTRPVSSSSASSRWRTAGHGENGVPRPSISSGSHTIAGPHGRDVSDRGASRSENASIGPWSASRPNCTGGCITISTRSPHGTVGSGADGCGITQCQPASDPSTSLCFASRGCGRVPYGNARRRTALHGTRSEYWRQPSDHTS